MAMLAARAGTMARPFSSSFDPLSLSPHVLLDPDTFGLANNDPVASATDTSGNARHFTEATNKPTYHAADLNGRGTVQHVAASSQKLTGPSLAALTNGHGFHVVKADADPGSGGGSMAFGTATFHNHYPYTDGNIYEAFGSTVRKTVGNPGPSLAAWRIYEVRSALNDWEALLDGVSLFSTATNVVGFSPTPRIGSNDLTSPAYFDGRWAWFGLFPALGSTDAGNVRTYLQSRFGL